MAIGKLWLFVYNKRKKFFMKKRGCKKTSLLGKQVKDEKYEWQIY